MNLAALAVLVLLTVIGIFMIVDGVSRFVSGVNPLKDSGRAVDAAAGQSVRIAKPTMTSVGGYLQVLLQRADMHSSLQVIIGVVSSAVAAAMLIIYLVLPGLPFWAQALLAVVTVPAILIAYVHSRIRRRTDTFMELFPDALDLIVRSLRIGHPISVAMATVGNEMADPIGKEFRIVAQQIAYGMSPPLAVEALANRIEANDVKFFAVTIQIQYEAGGNLSEILESLSATIRSRFQLFRRVKALTAEGRFSAWFLTLLPVVMIFIINFLQPGYYQSVSDFEYYVPIVVITLLMLALNAVVAHWVTRLKV
jgi:tight adherence protein B